MSKNFPWICVLLICVVQARWQSGNKRCSGACHPNAQCLYNNGIGNYECKCYSGYEGDGRECSIRTEGCKSKRDCSIHAHCVSGGSGGKRCSCDNGYEGDGYTCTLKSEKCSSPKCDANAECLYETPSKRYKCFCKEGYDGDGHFCTPEIAPGCLKYSVDETMPSTPIPLNNSRETCVEINHIGNETSVSKFLDGNKICLVGLTHSLMEDTNCKVQFHIEGENTTLVFNQNHQVLKVGKVVTLNTSVDKLHFTKDVIEEQFSEDVTSLSAICQHMMPALLSIIVVLVLLLIIQCIYVVYLKRQVRQQQRQALQDKREARQVPRSNTNNPPSTDEHIYEDISMGVLQENSTLSGEGLKQDVPRSTKTHSIANRSFGYKRFNDEPETNVPKDKSEIADTNDEDATSFKSHVSLNSIYGEI